MVAAPTPHVVASTGHVVASVVASREEPHATTHDGDNATTRPAVVAAASATTRPALAWRIEINRRPLAGGGWSYHWLYRFGSGDQRRAVYGGTVDRLIAFNPNRWQKYLEVANGKGKARTPR